jgi:hypothetical protein
MSIPHQNYDEGADAMYIGVARLPANGGREEFIGGILLSCMRHAIGSDSKRARVDQ